MRTLWKGAVSFGLVNIPVKMYVATERKDIKFHYLHKECMSPIQYRKYCPNCDREIASEEIVRGYEYQKGNFVVINEEDLERIPLESTKTIDILDFVDLAQVDPIYFDKTYYLEPSQGGEKAYTLLIEAMSQTGKVAIAKVIIRSKESLAALRVKDQVLIMETIFWPDEIRSPSSLDLGVDRAKLHDNEIKMAVSLIENLSTDFEPAKYQDEHRQALWELIESKIVGKEVVAAAPAVDRGNVVDLMEALKASVKLAEETRNAQQADSKSRQAARGRGKTKNRELAAVITFPESNLVEPMMPVLVKEIIESPEYVYQVKWDGVRMLAYLSAGRVTLVNKNGHLRTGQYPELQELAFLLQVPSAILDGELVVLKGGKPSFPSILKRDLSSASQAGRLMKLYPLHYMVFDIPFAGRDLRNLTLTERQSILEKNLVTNDWVHTVENFTSGHSLFSAIKAQDMEGIVIKRSASLYIGGKKHRDWLKVKNRRIQYCVVGGYTLRGTMINALLLGVYHQEDLLYVGKVGTGLKQEEWNMLTRELPRMSIPHSPFVNKPPTQGYYFVHPRLTVKIEFAEWTESLTLRSPVIAGFSNKPADDCTLE